MQTKAIMVLAALPLALAACGQEQKSAIRADFGNAIRHNMAVQIIDPEPAPASPEGPYLHGSVGERVLEQYVTGNVPEPEPVATSDVGR